MSLRLRMNEDTAAPDAALEPICRPDAGAPLADALPDEAVARESVQLLKGMADGTRLKILCLLRGREVCVHELVGALDVTQSAVSHQLRVLRSARLVRRRKEGRHAYYRLADAHVEQMLSNVLLHGREPQE
jgi:ArsR family transcriptional regulator